MYEEILRLPGKKVRNMCDVAQNLINIGEAKGKAEGMVEGGIRKLYELVQEGILSVSDAAKNMGVSEDAFTTKMQACGYNLPK